jgi:glucoamylase
MANTGGGDTGAATTALTAYEGKAFLSLKGASRSPKPRPAAEGQRRARGLKARP